ncbi:MAG: PAS domain S-box protein [Anaerolineae bacterium]
MTQFKKLLGSLKLGRLKKINTDLLSPQRAKYLVGLVDLALLLNAFFFIFSTEKIFAFHVTFFFLTLGAFYWEFKAFLWRSVFWVSATSGAIFIFVKANIIPVGEVVEIPLLTGILVLVFIIAAQRRRADKALRVANQELENRVVERTSALTRLNNELVLEIIEHKRTEESLRKLSSVVEQTADIVVITDKEGVIEYVNPAFENEIGYTSEEAIGQTPRILKSGRHKPQFYKTMWDTILAGNVHQGVVINRKKSGQLYYEEKTITPLRDSRGNITHFVSTSKDITQRQQAEVEREQLLATEREQRLVAETLGDVFLALAAQTSPQNVMAEILRQVRRLVSHSAANIMLLDGGILRVAHHHGYRSFGSKDMVSRLEQSLSNFPLDAKVVQSRQPLVVPDTRQNPHWVTLPKTDWIRSFITVPICLGDQVLGLLRLDSDTANTFSAKDADRLQPLANAAAITLENARLYDRLRQMAAKNQAILDAIPDSMFHLNQTGDLLDYKITDGANLLPGITGEAHAGRHLSSLLPPDLTALTLQQIDQALQSGAMQIYEYQLPGPAGTREFEARLVVNGPHEVLAIVRDITERKARAAALEQERARISRDLHDGLAQMLGYLRLKLDSLTIDPTLQHLESIQTELAQTRDVADEAYDLVRNMLAAARPANAADLSKGLLAQAQTEGNRAGFKVNLTSRGRARPLAPVVQHQVLYLFQEALVNVAKHARARQVDLSLRWTSDTLTITLADDGRGFDTAGPQPEGHYGLLIMQERAEEIHGQIQIDSHPDRGTTITLRLPLAPSGATVSHRGNRGA